MTSGILLAAGESRRMGSPKALLPCHGQTFLERSCRAFFSAEVEELIVVLGAWESRLRPALPRHPALRTVVNPHYTLGQLSSLGCGLRALSPTSDAAVVNLVDHPLVRAETIAALIASFRAAPVPISIATYWGKRGHPVLFSRQVYAELLAAPLDQGAKVVVRKDPARVRPVSLNDPGVVADIDTPQEYRHWTGLSTPGS